MAQFVDFFDTQLWYLQNAELNGTVGHSNPQQCPSHHTSLQAPPKWHHLASCGTQGTIVDPPISLPTRHQQNKQKRATTRSRKNDRHATVRVMREKFRAFQRVNLRSIFRHEAVIISVRFTCASVVPSLNNATPHAAQEIGIVEQCSTLLFRSAAAFLKSLASKCA